MKKNLLFFIMLYLISNLSSTVLATSKIDGLNYCLNETMMRNYITEEQRNQVESMIASRMKDCWQNYTDYYNDKYNHLPKNIPSEFQIIIDEVTLDYDNGVLIYQISNPEYSVQYSNEQIFDYLILPRPVWLIPHKSSKVKGATRISYDFTSIDCPLCSFDFSNLDKETSLIDYNTINLFNDVNVLNDELIKLGVKQVQDIKLCQFAMYKNFILINTDKGCLAINLYQYNLDHKLNIKTLKTVIQELTDKFSSKKEKPDYTTEAESLVSDGLLYGNENGLDLLKPITRAEAATILIRALGVDENTPQVATFSDVASSFWGFKYIEEAAKLGIVQGMGDGTFSPNAQVTDNQFATMVLRAAKETDFDWETAINLFVERGYITQEQADRMDLFTRGDMAKLIYEAKQHGMISK